MGRYLEIVFDVIVVVASIVSVIMSFTGLAKFLDGQEFSLSLEVITSVIAILGVSYLIYRFDF